MASLNISHLLAKAIPVRGANLKKADVHRRLLFAFYQWFICISSDLI